MTTQDGGVRVIALCDGSASWGYGKEAARVAAVSIQRAVERAGNLATADEIVFAASRRARAEFSVAGEDAPVFSVLIVLIGAARVELAWVGDASIQLVREGETVERGEPHVIVAADTRVVTCALPGDVAWEIDRFLAHRVWPLRPGDRVLYAVGDQPASTAGIAAAR